MNISVRLPQESDSAATRVERELRRAIISLELRPGSRLSEQDVAQRYGVSRQPAREALIGLARTKLVETQPQRGTVVVRISVRKMLEARFVREALETAVVRRACESFAPRQRDRTHDLLDAQSKAVGRNEHEEFRRLDELFHVALAEGAGCAMAWEAIADIKAHMDRVCQLTQPHFSSPTALIDQHRAILAAVEVQDPDAAEAAMRLHLTEILRALPQVERAHPDLFDPD